VDWKKCEINVLMVVSFTLKDENRIMIVNIFLCLISFHIGKGADITSARDTTKVAQIEGRFKTALLLDDITLVTITTKSNPPTHSIFAPTITQT
jgi:hypothetical protein